MAKKIRQTKTKAKKKIDHESISYEMSSGNVFVDFGYANPEEAQAKWDLSYLIKKSIQDRGLTQKQAAELMSIDQPKVSKIISGILSEFTLERLMKYLVSLGYDVEIKATQNKAVKPSIHVRKPASINGSKASTRLL